jgi:hypothetical protein
MAHVEVILYTPVIDHMRSWDGDIGRSVLSLCRDMRRAQQAFAPRKTGLLKRSIEIGPLGRGALGIATAVGANPGQSGVFGYGFYQEVGTRPHIIRARPDNPTGYMVFFWPKVGQVVRFRSVSHPGHRGTHWAMKGAAAAMLTWS